MVAAHQPKELSKLSQPNPGPGPAWSPCAVLTDCALWYVNNFVLLVVLQISPSPYKSVASCFLAIRKGGVTLSLIEPSRNILVNC